GRASVRLRCGVAGRAVRASRSARLVRIQRSHPIQVARTGRDPPRPAAIAGWQTGPRSPSRASGAVPRSEGLAMPVDVEQLAADADRLMAAARAAGPSARVPGCPGGSIQELLRHVGAVHRRFGLVIAERRSKRPGREESTPPPTDPYDWFDET